MRKIIENRMCPNCHKMRRFENYPEHIGAGGVILRLFLALFLLAIPVIGWIASIALFVSIFTDTKGEKELYCSSCGTKIRR